MSKTYIKTEDISVTVKKARLLSNVTTDFEEAKIHGIFGGIGSGKTMLLKCICGVAPVYHGEIIVNNTVMRKGSIFPDSLGICFETQVFTTKFSGYENLKLLESLRGRPDKDELCQVLEAVGLSSEMDLPVSSYSQGMRQKLAIAQAIIGAPKCLLMDEPFNYLDEETILNVQKLLRQFQQNGSTILIASSRRMLLHDFCDSVYDITSGITMKPDRI